MTQSELKMAMQQAGALFADETSVQPLHFGSAAEEYAKHGASALLFCLPEQTLLEVTGADRANWLHKFCSNDIAALPAGRWCEAFVTDINSHVVAHLQIYAEADSLWITTAASCSERLLTHLDRYIFNDDVTFHNRTDDYEILLLSGADASEQLNELATIEQNGHAVCELSGASCAISRVDRLREPGYLIRVPAATASNVWQGIIDAGVSPAGSLSYEALRIAAGWPVNDLDITIKTLAQEVGRTPQAISFTKGCYLGQEPIARIDALGHVNKLLTRLQISSAEVPQVGVAICTTSDNKEIGQITSAANSYDDNQTVALGYLRRKEISAETELQVEIDGKPVPVTVQR